MTDNLTYGYLKKRVFDALDEYSENDGVFVTDTNREILLSRMPDAVTSSLIRMYESLAAGKGECTSILLRPRLLYKASFVPKEGERAVFDKENLGVSFCAYGSGSLVFESDDSDGSVSIDCEGGGIKKVRKEFISLPCTGSYTIKTQGNVDVMNLGVYDKGSLAEKEAVPMPGYIGFQLPDDFDGFITLEGKDKNICHVSVCDNASYGFISEKLFSHKKEIRMEYKKASPVITGETEDSFVFDISALAFEALVSLCASELCRQEESGMYTRLLYRYSDLSEGLYKSKYSDIFFRNGFFKSARRMR